MSYVELKKLNEDKVAGKDLAVDALKSGGFTHQEGLGGVSLQLNKNGFAINPADKLPDGLLDKIKTAWEDSGHNMNTFFNSEIDGKSVRSIFQEMPSQQAYDVPSKLNGFPRGTSMPSALWKDSQGRSHTAIKWGPAAPAAAHEPAPAPVPTEPADPEKVGSIDGEYTGPRSDWWKFFTDPKFLIGVAAIAGIVALLKSLQNSIKIRFRKCAKVLYRMQKDFGGAENGMDMRAVLPGVGSQIMDWIARRWGSKKGPGAEKGAIGLRPFVDGYVNEIAADYDQAVRSYNMIASYKYENNAETTTSGAMNNFEKPTAPESPATESVNVDTKVYESFADALNTTTLNEGQQVNEALGTVIAAGSLALSAIRMFKGQFRMKAKDANGQYVEKSIAVTKKSTREICYAILNMYYGKYFNLERVFKKMGIDDFADVDVSNVDKFQKIANRMAETSDGDFNDTKNVKMYARVRKNYDSMVDRYIGVANGVVENFKKYTRKKKIERGKDLGEKDSNLLNAAYEKLKAELDRQEDAYKNNFGRVLNAIISSPEYAKFTDLIIKKVIPLFKTGLAGDADYVLDLLPKVGDYYVVRQTGSQEGLNQNDEAKGNTALVRILDVKKEGQEGQQKVSVVFARTALLQSVDINNLNTINHDGRTIYDLSTLNPENIDRTAFSKVRGKEADRSEGGDSITLAYGKWIALDPREVINVPGDDRDPEDMKRTKLYRREFNVNGKDIVEYAFGETLVSEGVEGPTTQEFAEDVDISEADVKLTSEKGEQPKGDADPMNKDANIRKVVCVNISKDQEPNLLSGNIQQLQFTGAYIELENACTALKLGEILTNPKNFNPNPAFEMLSGKTKEKDAIANLISQQTGYTHVSHQKAANVDDIAPILNKIETRQTTTEKLTDAIPAIAEDVKQILDVINNNKANAFLSVKDSNPNQKGLYIPSFLNGKDNTGVSQQLAALQLKHGSIVYKNGWVGYISNEIKNVKGDAAAFIIDIDSFNEHMFTVADASVEPRKDNQIQIKLAVNADEFFNKWPLCYRLGLTNHNDIKGLDAPASEKFTNFYKIDSGQEQEAIKQLIGVYVNQLVYEPKRGEDVPREQPAQPEQNVQPENQSFNVTYSDMFNLAESFMGTLSYLNVHRFIKPEQRTKEQYYVLSENAWGDGITVNPVAKLNEFIKNTLAACETYDDFTRLSKSSVSINFMPVNEDCSYKTVLPYNRYQMLTEANPLYEATVILSFDDFGRVNNIIDKGVTKICK